MVDIANPHDRFFKEVLSRQEVARDFIIHYLPSDLVGLLDLQSLEIRKDSFIARELKEYFSDILEGGLSSDEAYFLGGSGRSAAGGPGVIKGTHEQAQWS